MATLPGEAPSPPAPESVGRAGAPDVYIQVSAVEVMACPEWRQDPWVECYVEASIGGEQVGKTEFNDQPRWTRRWKLELPEEEVQVKFDLYQYDPRMEITKVKASCFISSKHITRAFRTLRHPMKPSGLLVVEVTAGSEPSIMQIDHGELAAQRGGDVEKEFHVNGHKFVATAFNQPVFCAVDKEFVWGLGKQGLSCSWCQMNIHKNCYNRVMNQCPKGGGGAQGVTMRGDAPALSGGMGKKIQHSWELTTYWIPTFCDHDGQLLVGLRNQGWKCTNNNCSLNVHDGCRELTSLLCGVDNALMAKIMEDIANKDITRLKSEFKHLKSVGGKVTLSDFKLLTVLGRGGYGKVLLAEKKSGGQLCAIKAISKKEILEQDCADVSMLEREILALGEGCRFLTAMFASFQTTERLFFVMEFVSGGDLFHHIVKDRKFSENRTRFYTAELTLALEFLHNKGIIHRDIKPENVMLTNEGHAKLTDFGMCKKDMLPPAKTRTYCGTPSFMAPEILRHQGYAAPADWWALGVLVYNMLFGRPPFRAKGEQVFKMIKEEKVVFPANNTLSEVGKDLVLSLLTKDPAKRLGSTGGAEELKQHTFFEKMDWDLLAEGEVTPPYVPKLKSDHDTSCFDAEFTDEKPEVTPIVLKRDVAKQCAKNFPQFSFTAQNF